MFAVGLVLVVIGVLLSSQGEYMEIAGDWASVIGYILMLASLVQVAWRWMP